MYAFDAFIAIDVVTNISWQIRTRLITNTNVDGHTSCLLEADGRIVLQIKDMV